MEESECISSRVKRQKVDKSGRSAALERFKLLRGTKNKCEIGEIKNVYEYIDEKEYSKRVLARQDEDWLENPGDGYFEDGREIFDEEDDDSDVASKSYRSDLPTKRKKIEKDKKMSKNILQMVSKMSGKKKNSNQDNDILHLLDQSLNCEKNLENSVINNTTILSSKEYLKMLSTNKNPNPKKSSQNDFDNSVFNENFNEINKNQPMQIKLFQDNTNTNQEMQSNNIVKESRNCDLLSEKDNIKLEKKNEKNTPEKEKVELESVDENSKVENIKLNLKTSPKEIDFLNAQSQFVNQIVEDEIFSDTSNNKNDYAEENVSVKNNENLDLLPLFINLKKEKVFRFFWWDAYEDPIKQPGVVYLFGKAYHEKKSLYLSCCVTVENIPRKIYLLPREKRFDMKTNKETNTAVSLLDVYQEFNEKFATPNKIMHFKSRTVTLKYAFDLPDVPYESEYLEIKYSSKYIKFPHDLSGETFCRVFGTNTSSLEILLLEQKIKGPCWIEVQNPQTTKVRSSWCKLEARALKMEDINISETVSAPPPLVLMTVNIRSIVNINNLENEIIMIGILVKNQYKIDKPLAESAFDSHFCAITRSSSLFWPKNLENLLQTRKKTDIVIHQAEKSLLNYFLTKLFNIDPDVIVGEDFFGFTFDVLMQRVQQLKVPNWSRIGRLRRALIPQFKGKQTDKTIACGRLICDVVTSAKEFIRARSYDLTTLCKLILNLEGVREDFTSEEIVEKFQNPETIQDLISATMEDATYILRIIYELNVLPLALQITKIAGNVMSKTLTGGRSERNEFLLLHAFTEKKFLVPDKINSKKNHFNNQDMDCISQNEKKKSSYTGGLVLEPKRGFYDKFILLMDFNSLYPSIIQEYNICFTTIKRIKDDEKEDGSCENQSLGILPVEIQKLVKTRREVKSLMKAANVTAETYAQLNIRQMALKLTANSMYGCLGFTNSRFYGKSLAALVTSKGREILIQTKNIVEKMNFEVIYGDTDSIMINTNSTNYDEVIQIGQQIKDEINKLYKYIELDVDGVFKYMLLLKKKKYAAIIISKKSNGELIETPEYKGLDIVRRDWCQLSAEVGKNILNQILSNFNIEDKIRNIKELLEQIGDDLRNKRVPMSLLTVSKQLNKNPEDYNDSKSFPHLQVALRMNSKNSKKIKAGHTVSYVICDTGTNLPPPERAYHVDELKFNSGLLIDVKYYLTQQIFPVVNRLCEPIDRIDSAFIAECLGLDPSKYRKFINNAENDIEINVMDDYLLQNDMEAFRRSEPFSFVCQEENCGTMNFIDGPLRDGTPSLSKCRNPSCIGIPIQYSTYIMNELTTKIRYYVGKFYQNWMICNNPGCPNRTQKVFMAFSKGFPICKLCRRGVMYREFTSTDLHYQIKFYQYIFNLEQLIFWLFRRVETLKKDLPLFLVISPSPEVSPVLFATGIISGLNCPLLYTGCDITLPANVKEVYAEVYEKVKDVLKDSAYYWLDMDKIFNNKRKEMKIQKTI